MRSTVLGSCASVDYSGRQAELAGEVAVWTAPPSGLVIHVPRVLKAEYLKYTTFHVAYCNIKQIMTI